MNASRTSDNLSFDRDGVDDNLCKHCIDIDVNLAFFEEQDIRNGAKNSERLESSS